jgi:GT2 family glycosyltransferase
MTAWIEAVTADPPDRVLPPTSLIIPTRNRPALLAETIESVLQGDALPAELIVIDQSDSAHAEIAALGSVRGCTVRYHRYSETGLSRARNRGIALAGHEVLVFTDDDVRVSRSWLGTLIAALLREGPRTVVTGQVLPEQERTDGFVPSTKVAVEAAAYEGRIGADVLYPHNMAMYRSLVDEVGEFDVRLGAGTRFAGSEDNDFAFRLLEAGFRIVYVPDAVVHHRAWRPASAYLPLRWSYGRGQGAFYAKHSSLRDRYMLWRLSQEVLQRSGRFFRYLPGNPRRALGQLVSLSGVLSGYTQWLVMGRRENP